ncbi:MAG: isopentenyl phosphate kinase [Candidatus Hermodarchaeota archaeon]|jgi:isopentenyl phosphate kinase|nr:isopentenyl phosphate kinase [Candidatus Hermodarchaeota archaeon]
MVHDLTIIKLGGALITDKSKPYTLRPKILKQAIREIAEVLGPCVIIHGVGSFGHVPVIERKLYAGFTSASQLPDLSQTMVEVFDLRMAVTKAVLDAGLSPVIFLPSNIFFMTNGEISGHFSGGLRQYLDLGMTVLIGGDMSADSQRGFSVCSGDKVAHLLAHLLNPKHIIFATDVAGFYTSDPKLDKKAKLIPEISLNNIEAIEKLADEAATPDITKGMRGKIEEIKGFESILKAGAKVVLLGMMKPGILRRYMQGDSKVPCTRIIL